MDSEAETGGDNASQVVSAQLDNDVEANGVECDPSPEAIMINARKPLVYNYEDTDPSEDQWPSDSNEAVYETPEGEPECKTGVGLDAEGPSLETPSESHFAEMPSEGSVEEAHDESQFAEADTHISTEESVAGIDEMSSQSLDAEEFSNGKLVVDCSEAESESEDSGNVPANYVNSQYEPSNDLYENKTAEVIQDVISVEKVTAEIVPSKDLEGDEELRSSDKEDESVVPDREDTSNDLTETVTSEVSDHVLDGGDDINDISKEESEIEHLDDDMDAKIEQVKCEGNDHEKTEDEPSLVEETFAEESRSVLVIRGEGRSQNFKSVLLEDWDMDGSNTPAASVGQDEVTSEEVAYESAVGEASDEILHDNAVEETPQPMDVELVHTFQVDGFQAGNQESEQIIEKGTEPGVPATTAALVNSNRAAQNGVSVAPKCTPRRQFLAGYRHMTREEAVKELTKSKPAPLKAMLPKKDLILAMELAKHSSQGPLAVEDDDAVVKDPLSDAKREEIIEILEADQVGNWRGDLASSPEKAGNDLDIGRELDLSIERGSNGLPVVPTPMRKAGRKPGVKYMPIDKEAIQAKRKQEIEARALARKLALEQLAKEFSERPRRRKGKTPTSVAAVDLERALASTPVLTGKRKRRPCYQPGSQLDGESEVIEANPSAIIKTYTPKPRPSDAKSEVQTGLETIAIVNRHLYQGVEDEAPKEQKTVKKIKKINPQKKRARELRQLLGDEGAIRMLYDAAQKDAPLDGQPPRVFKKTKKGLQQQTKFVENAVLRLSGASEKSLRGKRLAVTSDEPTETAPVEPLFPPAAPTISPGGPAPGRGRKKPKPAEASRILYRHSSSESFDGSEGLRRSASEIAGLDASPERIGGASPAHSGPQSSAPRKSSRPRKVSTKFSVYVAESLTPKKGKKSEGSRLVSDPKIKAEPDSGVTPSLASPQSSPAVPPVEESEEIMPHILPKAVKVVHLSQKQTTDDLHVTCRGHLVEISLSSPHPSIQNGFTVEVMVKLQKALESAAANPACKAILLTSEGAVFCQGIDLALLAPGSDIGPLVTAIKALVTTLATLSKPVLAGVQGAAVGMGVALLPLCDVVVASEAASFSTPYTRLGQGLEAAASFTFPRIGNALVSELVYKCSKLSAADALRLGLVSQTVPAKAFPTELARVAEVITLQSEQALRTAKELLTGGGKESLLEALDRECAALLQAWTNAECLAAAAEFLASGELLPNA